MNHLKTDTEGIDCSIKDLQQQLYPSLVAKWGEIDMYGRAYRNPKGRSYAPEIFSNDRYIEMLPNSKKRGLVYFIDGTEHTNLDEGLFEAELKIVFLLNLRKIFGEGRRDDKAQTEAFQSVEKDVHGNFDPNGIEKTIEKVFSGFDTSKIKNEDMGKYHVFAIKGKLRYELLNSC